MQSFEPAPSKRMEIASPIADPPALAALRVHLEMSDLSSRASLPAPGRVRPIHLAHHVIRIGDDQLSGGPTRDRNEQLTNHRNCGGTAAIDTAEFVSRLCAEPCDAQLSGHPRTDGPAVSFHESREGASSRCVHFANSSCQ